MSLFEALPAMGLLILNRAFEVVYANDYACQLFKLQHNSHLGKYNKLPQKIQGQLKTELRYRHVKFSIAYRQHTKQTQVQKLDFVARYDVSKRQYILGIQDQTAQESLQEQLRQTEQFLDTLLNTSTDFICIKNGNNQWLKANQQWLDFLGIEADNYQNASSQGLANMTHPHVKSLLLSAEYADEEAWRLRKPHQHEEVIALSNGAEKTLRVTETPIFGTSGERQHIAMFAQDITEQKLIEKQLKNRASILDVLISCDWLLHSADSWQTVAKTVLQQCCLALRFTRGAILKINPPDGETLQYATCLAEWSNPGFISPSSNLAQIDFNHPDLARWATVLQQGNPVFTEVNQLPATEHAILKQQDTVNIAIVPLLIENKWWGNIIIERCYDADKTTPQEMGALMAISRSLGAAIQREQAGNNLNLAEIAFDSADEGMMIVNTAGTIVGINRGYTKITGYSEEESLGRTPPIFEVAALSLWEALDTHGKWRGEQVSHRKSGEQYHERITITAVKNDEGEVMNYVGVFTDISEIKASQEKLRALVNHDPLTGLPNRRLINELIQRAIQNHAHHQKEIALLFIDLDRFKSINDSLGHQYGDKLLYEVSERIRASIHQDDVAARLGGDEFIVMMENINSREDAEHRAKKILNALQIEFIIDNKELFISASIGIAVFPDDGKTVESIIKAADIAMYQVKNSGKNNYCFYAEELSNQVVERFNIENQLRRAIERNQFHVYYQPQIDIASGHIIGAEALVRWEHPEMGLVSPDRFIPLAEETGLILQIGEWVLTQAAMTASRWVGQHNNLKSISVNVSGIQIMQSNFTDTVYGVLIETDCAPDKLELEITESTVMQNTESVIETFNNIKGLGLGLAIDDFGTGYSSLSHLKRLPLDKLKIDRSFIKDLPDDLDDAAIANAIYAMASSLGFSVIAEGVETSEQEAFLLEMGCHEAQGYRYSKPISSDAFNALMAQNEYAIGGGYE